MQLTLGAASVKLLDNFCRLCRGTEKVTQVVTITVDADMSRFLIPEH